LDLCRWGSVFYSRMCLWLVFGKMVDSEIEWNDQRNSKGWLTKSRIPNVLLSSI
jgi:hypothetical protein